MVAWNSSTLKLMCLYIHIPPCPPEAVAISEDEEGTVGTCPKRGEAEN